MERLMKPTAVHSNNRIRERNRSRRQDNDLAGCIKHGMWDAQGAWDARENHHMFRMASYFSRVSFNKAGN